MKAKDANEVARCIEWEGMWYCFNGYSAFPEIEDEKFHELRNAFLDAGHALQEYVGYE